MSSAQDKELTAKACMVVWLALAILLGLTIVLSFLKLGVWSLVVALVIAAMKVGLIGAYYMHVRYEPALLRLAAFAGLYWFGILLSLTTLDYLSRF